MNFAEVHKKRLKNDYEEMCCLANSPMVSWKATKGEAPYVEEYLLTINVRTYSGPGVIMNQCNVRISLPMDYPKRAPKVVMEEPVVFHPNWYANGMWDYGWFQCSESLGNFVARMIRSLQYDPMQINLYSPSNTEAKRWYLDNQEQLSADNQVLSNPYA